MFPTFSWIHDEATLDILDRNAGGEVSTLLFFVGLCLGGSGACLNRTSILYPPQVICRRAHWPHVGLISSHLTLRALQVTHPSQIAVSYRLHMREQSMNLY
jgi:hypothetical protein